MYLNKHENPAPAIVFLGSNLYGNLFIITIYDDDSVEQMSLDM